MRLSLLLFNGQMLFATSQLFETVKITYSFYTFPPKAFNNYYKIKNKITKFEIDKQSNSIKKRILAV